MAEYDYDLFVIGAGSGGVRASRIASSLGARVAVAEDRYLGGTCVNVGCIPKKLLAYAAHFHDDFEDAESFGWSLGERRFDWSTLIANKDKEIKRLNGIYESILTNAGVEIIHGRATIEDAHTILVNGRKLSCANILVATGGWPSVPDIPGKDLAITSNEVFYLEKRPEKVLIVGGGYIAVEFAGIFNGLGVDTTQVYRGPLFMRGFDGDVRRHLAQEMARKGVKLLFDSNVASLARDGEGIVATLDNGDELRADLALYATGRVPMTGNLGLEKAGVALNDKGAVIVDKGFGTNVPSIYAIGDVIDRVQLTPVALAEGMLLARALFGGGDGVVDYETIPTAVFSQPTIGTVGLTEEEARARHGAVDIYRSRFRQLKHTLTPNQEQTMMKLVVDRDSDRVLGAHMVGPEAGEIIQGLGIALKLGAKKADFDRTIGIHPTAAEEFVTMREPVSDGA